MPAPFRVRLLLETTPTTLPAREGAAVKAIDPIDAETRGSAERAAWYWPEAEEILASDNPVAELPPAAVALVYLVQFGEDTQYPVIDGPRPPDALLDAAAASWDDLPLTVYAKRIPQG